MSDESLSDLNDGTKSIVNKNQPLKNTINNNNINSLKSNVIENNKNKQSSSSAPQKLENTKKSSIETDEDDINNLL
jgi:hypothetical protein